MAAAEARRPMGSFVAAHLAFITVGRDYETAERAWVERLSRRYAQDFGPLARKYGIIGTPEQCAATLERYMAGGCSYFLMNAICDPADEREQLEMIAADIMPRFRGR